MRLIYRCTLALSAGGSIVSRQSTASISEQPVFPLIDTPTLTDYVTTTKRDLPRIAQTVQATPSASFKISRLRSGTCTNCVNASGFLNPCNWNLPTLTVAVGTGLSSAGNRLTLKLGAVAKLSIQAPSNLLSQKTSTGSNPFILAGAWTGKATNALLPTVFSSTAVRPPLLPTQLHPVHQAGTCSSEANFE